MSSLRTAATRSRSRERSARISLISGSALCRASDRTVRVMVVVVVSCPSTAKVGWNVLSMTVRVVTSSTSERSSSSARLSRLRSSVSM